MPAEGCPLWQRFWPALALAAVSGENRRSRLSLVFRNPVPSSTTYTTRPKTTGLRYWMLRVLEECDHVSADFAADPVHDLRVSLRRCRSLAARRWAAVLG